MIIAIPIGLGVAALLAWLLRSWRLRGRAGDYARWAIAGVGGMLAVQGVLLALGAPMLVGTGTRAVPGGAVGMALILGSALGMAFGRGARLTGEWRELERDGRRH
jgi:hypothetical protein